MTYANDLDPDEAPQNVGIHLRSKLFDIQIIYQQNICEETLIFGIFWKKKIFEKSTQHAELNAKSDQSYAWEWVQCQTREVL